MLLLFTLLTPTTKSAFPQELLPIACKEILLLLAKLPLKGVANLIIALPTSLAFILIIASADELFIVKLAQVIPVSLNKKLPLIVPATSNGYTQSGLLIPTLPLPLPGKFLT